MADTELVKAYFEGLGGILSNKPADPNVKQFMDPQEAYNLMNQWTRIKTSYEIQFAGKEVKRVDIRFKGDQPIFATVHYTKGEHIGWDSIDLSQKMLLDEPDKILNIEPRRLK